MIFSNKMTLTIGLLLIMATSMDGCKKRSDSSKSKSLEASSDIDMERFKVIDCPIDVCGKGLKLSSVIQDAQDQTIAMEMRKSYENYALDSSSSTKLEGGKEANTPGQKLLQKSSSVISMAGDLFKGKNESSSVTQTGLSSLLSSLNPMLQKLDDAAKFAANSIDAENDVDRLKTLNTIKVLADDVGRISTDENQKSEKILSILEVLAGKDGWLNYGDQARITAVVPQIVGRIADEKISREAPGQIAYYQQYYRSQLPLGGFLVGGIVDSRVEEEVMNTAYGRKWQAVNEASNKAQSEYNSLMNSLGVESYYLLMPHSKDRYWDPAPPISAAQMETLVESFGGKKINDLVDEYERTGQSPAFVSRNAKGAISDLSKKISLPDGIPVVEIRRIMKENRASQTTVYPEGMQFKLLANGKLEIRRKLASARTASSSGSNGEKLNLNCTAVTKLDNAKTIVYLYSSIEAASLSLLTGEGWFEMITPNQAQPPLWNFVRSGVANEGWRSVSKLKIKVGFWDGTSEICEGKVHHL